MADVRDAVDVLGSRGDVAGSADELGSLGALDGLLGGLEPLHQVLDAAGTSPGCALRMSVSWRTTSRSRARYSKPSMPVSASMRRLPAPTEPSDVMTTVPICDERSTCVPPQSSRDQGPPISTTRTSSPYVSPNSASAPKSRASCSDHGLRRDGQVGTQGAVGGLLDAVQLVGRQRAAPAVVESQVAGAVVGTRLQRGRAEHLAQRGVHDVRAGVRLTGTEAPFGVDGSLDVLVAGQLALEHAYLVDDETAYGTLDVEHLGATAVPGDDAGIGVLATGLGVERGAVEHDLADRAGDEIAGTSTPSASSASTRDSVVSVV